MAKCKDCMNYDEKYNEIRQSYDDVHTENTESLMRRFCVMYDEAISPDIIEEKKLCDYFISKYDSKYESKYKK